MVVLGEKQTWLQDAKQCTMLTSVIDDQLPAKYARAEFEPDLLDHLLDLK